ncbi:MAG: hypothetical protein SPI30_01960 [Prevotella sp.]|nr:hypothetical protein [Prevotella sp.]
MEKDRLSGELLWRRICATEMLPMIGMACTSRWYGLYQCLVVIVPAIGTMSNPIHP